MTSTALIPVKTYDVQVLDVMKAMHKPKAPFRAASTDRFASKAINAILTTVNGVCILGALGILRAFDYNNDTFHYNGDKWNITDLTLVKFFPECKGKKASETPVFWFWGGPPNRLKWYEGTLQTLLEDRILCEIQERGIEEVARWIGTDLETVV